MAIETLSVPIKNVMFRSSVNLSQRLLVSMYLVFSGSQWSPRRGTCPRSSWKGSSPTSPRSPEGRRQPAAGGWVNHHHVPNMRYDRMTSMTHLTYDL